MLFTCSISAQSFYIEPNIQTKAMVTSISSTIHSNLLINTTPYVQTKSLGIIWPDKLSPLTFGFQVGYETKNKNTRLSLGINGDGTASGYEYVVLAYNFEDNYSYTAGGYAWLGKSYTNLRLQLEQQIFTLGSTKFNLLVGLGGSLREKNLSGGVLGSDGITVMLADSSVQNVIYELRNNPGRFHANFTIGLKGDIYSSKGKYILSSSIFYTHGTAPLTTLDQNLSNSSKPLETYNNSFYSRDSGIYFQISRRIQFYPWKGFKTKSEI